MNILLFVTALMMVLAAMTYAKIESYRSVEILKAQYQAYSHHIERDHLKNQALSLYNKTHISSKQGKQKEQANAVPRINWMTIINKQARDNEPRVYEQVLKITKNLIQQLYGETPFYQEAISKRYHLIEDLFRKIDETIANLPEDKKPVKAGDLANLDLGEFELNQFFYKILKGNLAIEPPQEKPIDRFKFKALLEPKIDDDEAEEVISQDSSESYADEGYVSLLNFITLNNKNKIRLYLAPKELLLAIVEDTHRTEEIMEERYNLYLRLRRGEIEQQEATEQFKDFVSKYLKDYDEGLFDHTVTKTDPKRYGQTENR